MAEVLYSLEVFTPPRLLPLNEKKMNINNDGVISTKIRRSFQLFCNVDGFPEPTILWYKVIRFGTKHANFCLKFIIIDVNQCEYVFNFTIYTISRMDILLIPLDTMTNYTFHSMVNTSI